MTEAGQNSLNYVTLSIMERCVPYKYPLESLKNWNFMSNIQKNVLKVKDYIFSLIILGPRYYLDMNLLDIFGEYWTIPFKLKRDFKK